MQTIVLACVVAWLREDQAPNPSARCELQGADQQNRNVEWHLGMTVDSGVDAMRGSRAELGVSHSEGLRVHRLGMTSDGICGDWQTGADVQTPLRFISHDGRAEKGTELLVVVKIDTSQVCQDSFSQKGLGMAFPVE